MANNWTAVIDKLLAQGLFALREMAIMPRLVNRGYEGLAGEKGSTVDVPIPSSIEVQDVTPAATPPSTADSAPTSVPIQLNRWKEAPFYLTDKELLEVMDGTIPMQASEAVKALANEVDTFLLGLGAKFYGFHGTPGVTPFSADTTDVTQIRKVLNNQLAPMEPRHMVINADAEANALSLRAFSDASFSGSVEALINGNINRKLGFQWWLDQNVPVHTAGTASGATTDAAGYAIGVKTVTLAAAGTGTILVGDIITFAGHSQTYVVTSGDADVSNGGTISFLPGLQVALAASTVAITVKGSHAMNLAFHRDAIALATRPLLSTPVNEGLGSIMRSAVDPISGLALRLEIRREHKRIRYSYDMLYGAEVVRPELGARLAG